MIKFEIKMIPTEILLANGAELFSLEKNEFLFEQGNSAKYYYQIESGSVKMNNYNDDGKEFIQGIFYKNQSFGEPPLFEDCEYPANAVALEKSSLIKISKNQFFQLLEKHPKFTINITKAIAKRLRYKAIMAVEISSEEASHKILRLLDYIKDSVIQKSELSEISLTRQQIGDLTGLRVETVIRTLKQLEKNGKVKILNKKIWR